MNDYAILTDSACDLSQDMVQQLGVQVIPLHVTIDGQTYANTPDEREIRNADFFAMMRAGKMATTAAITPQQVLDAAEPLLAAGRDVLFLAFSSALSRTCASARMAARELNEKYAGSARMFVFDTLCASLGQGLLVWHAVQAQRAGLSLDELCTKLESLRPQLCHWFTVDDLHHLKRGGRVSAATAIVGSLLNIKPILHVDDEGRLIAVGKTRGRVASMRELVNRMQQTAIAPEHQTVFICHGDCIDDAQALAEMVRQTCHPTDIYINCIGPVIGAHAGPGTLSVFFVGDHR